MNFLHHLWQEYGPQTPAAYAMAQVVARLALSAVLGGIIGLERELHRKSAGLRTNMFICFGSAMFTILSYELAGQFVGDHTRIAAQIIPGIGFIGAGSIMHQRASVSGLTTAATIFVVASIGMACGGGYYVPAIFATFFILLALSFLGILERRFSLKALPRMYEVQGGQAEQIIAAVNGVLEDQHKIMQSVQVGRSNGHYRVQFVVAATQREHTNLLLRLRQVADIDKVISFESEEPE